MRPPRRCIVLGGAAVHDWFLERDLIDRIELTIEPLRFGTGLPLLTDQPGDPVAALAGRGFTLVDERRLNPEGTRLLLLTRQRRDFDARPRGVLWSAAPTSRELPGRRGGTGCSRCRRTR